MDQHRLSSDRKFELISAHEQGGSAQRLTGSGIRAFQWHIGIHGWSILVCQMQRNNSTSRRLPSNLSAAFVLSCIQSEAVSC